MIDSIRLVSQGLTIINEQLADMLPGPDFDALELKRNEVRAKLDYLTKIFFRESTARFIDDSHELVRSIQDMKNSLQGSDATRDRLETVGRFLNAVTQFVQLVAPVL